MLIDLIYFGILILAIFKGYSKGFVIAMISFFTIFIGLAAALKLSATVAAWLQKSTNLGERLLPIIAFAIVLIGVAFLTRMVARVIEKTLQLAMLGFINKVAGVVLYSLLYTIIFSVVLFFATKTTVLKKQTIEASYVYNFIEPLGPKAINAFSSLIPWFQNMFQQLEHFFDNAVNHTQITFFKSKPLF